MKKFLVILCIVLLACSPLMAKKIHIEAWTVSLRPAFDDFLGEVERSFEEAYPNIDVELIDVPWDGAEQKVLSAIAGGNPPDVVSLNTSWTTNMVAQGALEPLDAYINEVVRYDYVDGLWNASVHDGKSYAFPWYGGPGILIYNRAIFEEAGLDPDNPPSTWKEVLEYSRIIKEKTGKYGVEPGNAWGDFLSGLDLVSEDGKEIIFNNSTVKGRIEWFQAMYNEKLMPRTFGGYQEALQNFNDSAIAMYPTGMSMLKHIEMNSPEVYKTTDVAPAPLGDGIIPATAIFNFAIPVNAKHKEEGVLFAEWISSPRYQVEFCKHASILPSTVQSIDTDSWFTDKAESGDLNIKAQIMAAMTMRHAVDFNYIPGLAPDKFAQITRVIEDTFTEAVKGEMTAQEALDSAQAACEKIIAQ